MAERSTRQKEAIRAAFLGNPRPLSPEEVQRLAQSTVDGLSMATVYRNLSTLVGDGWLAAVELPGEPRRYEIAGKAHHHHFRCLTCNRVFDLEGCGIRVEQKPPRGFRVTGHEFFLYGECRDCRHA